MVLEMQAARLESTRIRDDLITQVEAPKKTEIKENASVTKVSESTAATENSVTLEKDKTITIKNNDIKEKYESKVSTLQVVSKALDEDREILTKMQDLVNETDFESMTREEKVEVQEELIKYVDDINQISNNTKFDGKTVLDGSYVDSDSDNKVELERIDSQTLGLSVDDISKLKLDSVRVAGESYMPPYSFDVTNPAGAGTALSVIGSAISKIDSYKRQVAIDMSMLTKYPEVLELDRSEYTAEQEKIRNAEAARRLVARLQNNIRIQINEAQRSQAVHASESVVNLFING